MRFIKQTVSSAAVLCVVFAATTTTAMAQTWPTKITRVVVPLSPGSGADVAGRLITDQVGRQVGKSFVVENRPGAGNTIGMAVVAKAEPDGYTVLANSSTHTVTTAIHETLQFNTTADLTPIIPFGSLPLIVVVNPSKGYKTLADLIAYAKANPGKVNYASAGAGNQSHLSAEMFRIGAGFEAVHIPMKGSPEAVQEVLSNRADFYVCPTNGAISLIKDGQLQGLAITGTARLPVLPDVPTFEEAGFKKPVFGSWTGLFVPSATPAAIKQKMYVEFEKALAVPELRKKLDDLGMAPMPLTQQQFEKLVKEEIDTYTTIATASGIRIK